MLSINTNLSSLIAQESMNTSTNKLNQAIERMTTGAKINHAKDNAANYSISTNMTTKIGAYDVAADNVAMSLDMLTTANDSLSLIEDKLSRLRALATQASNGSYGAQSLSAINSEANAITDEIERLFKTAEYNGIKLFDNGQEQANMPKAGVDGFIKTVEKQNTLGLDKLSEVNPNTDLADGTYSISSAQELAKLAQMTNAGFISEGDTFVLANDIDLAQWCADHAGEGGWTPIGNNTNKFLGTFDGNGYKISNLKINRSGVKFQGLFGRTDGNSIIKNLGVTNVDIRSDANCTGAIVGGVIDNTNTLIDNCYSTGSINGAKSSAGIAGQGGSIKNSYSSCSVISSADYSAGLVGYLINGSTIENCFATGKTSAVGNYSGGLLGGVQRNCTIKTCYATGDVTSSSNNSGGLIGYSAENTTVNNCYATGNITSSGYSCGGLVGQTTDNATISNCYATGDVTSTAIDYAQSGGLIGTFKGGAISNCYATGNVTGVSNWVGGLVGGNNSSTSTLIENCYATGKIKGEQCVGGLIGGNHAGQLLIISSYCAGNVTGNLFVGSFIGFTENNTINIFENCYTKSSITVPSGVTETSGFLGYMTGTSNVTMKNCSVLGTLDSNSNAVFASKSNSATLTIENCQYNSELIKSNVALVADANGVDITDDTIRAGVSTCGFITPFDFSNDIKLSLQVGIDSSQNSQLSLTTNFSLDYLNLARQIGQSEGDLFKAIDNMLNTISSKQTEFGAVQNRLESALDEILIQHDNLVSSRSTIKDADMAELSSTYIQQQILQQAAATLMSTANQSPSIALQLI